MLRVLARDDRVIIDELGVREQAQRRYGRTSRPNAVRSRSPLILST